MKTTHHLILAALSVFSLIAQAQNGQTANQTATQSLNQTPTMNLAPTPVPVATAAPVVGQNLPAQVPAPAPLTDSSAPQFQPPVQPPVQPQEGTSAARGWRPRTVNQPNQHPNQVPLPVQPKTPDVPGFVPSEVVAAPAAAAKVSVMRAVLRTSMGDITLKLDRLNAPRTVAQFIALSRGEKEFIDVKTGKPAKRPFYNGLIFHRVVKGTLIQTGDPFGTGRGDAGSIAPLPDEIKPTMKFSKPGMVAMAPMRDATGTSLVKNSNNSQFFITLSEMPKWDEQFTIFGEVEDGMDVVQKIANSKVGPTERPIKKVFLIAVEIIEN